jgi:hypothetical protein
MPTYRHPNHNPAYRRDELRRTLALSAALIAVLAAFVLGAQVQKRETEFAIEDACVMSVDAIGCLAVTQ